MEHTNAEYKQWRPLQRFTGRRETYAETHQAIAGLVSDPSARRATRRKPGTELVLARQATCGQIGRDRALMFDLAEKLEFTVTSEDGRVLDALAHAQRNEAARGEYISALGEDGERVDISFATQNWQKAVVDRSRPGQFVRWHFEAMVFTYLAEELRTGDVAVVGSEEFDDWSGQLLEWEVVEEKLPTDLVEVGLAEDEDTRPQPSTPPPSAGSWRTGCVRRRGGGRRIPGHREPDHRSRHRHPVAQTAPVGGTAALSEASGAGDQGADAGAHADRDLRTDRVLGGVVAQLRPALGQRPQTPGPVRPVRALHLREGHQHGPVRSRPSRPERERARAGLRGEPALPLVLLNEAIADLVNARARLDISQAWGDGTAVAADGTHMDTYLDNLLAETSVRYGKPGGIA